MCSSEEKKVWGIETMQNKSLGNLGCDCVVQPCFDCITLPFLAFPVWLQWDRLVITTGGHSFIISVLFILPHNSILVCANPFSPPQKKCIVKCRYYKQTSIAFSLVYLLLFLSFNYSCNMRKNCKNWMKFKN